MKLLPLLLLLAAADGPVALEPDVAGLPRLQPRRITASSFLKNGWNRAEQNYLPPYAADDDAATGWVEGEPGPGVGAWLLWQGPSLTGAKGYVVALRPGYQKSAKLYAANARPRRVRLEPLRIPMDGRAPVAAGAPLEWTLADRLGWQSIRLPTAPAVNAIRLTVLESWGGKSYEDLVISDLRVHVDAADPHVVAAEERAREELRAFVAARRAAAAEGAKRPPYDAPPEFRHKTLVEVELERAMRGPPTARLEALVARGKLAERPALLALVPRVRAALQRMERPPAPELAPVRRSPTVPLRGSSSAALEPFEDPFLHEAAAWLHTGGFALFEAKGETAARAVGPLDRPTAVRTTRTIDRGERDTYISDETEWIEYEGETATLFARQSVVPIADEDAGRTFVHLFTWKRDAAGRPQLAGVTSFRLDPWGFSIVESIAAG